MTSPWTGLDAAPAPFDDHVGPFPEAGFLESWYQHLGSGERIVASANDSILPLVVVDGVVSIAGEANVTDYHSPRGEDIDGLAESLKSIRDENTSVILDSLPEKSGFAFHRALGDIGFRPLIEDDAGTAVLMVENDYLSQLSRKQRHEVRRKHRRFLDMVGEPQLRFDSGEEDIDQFVSMHRASTGTKGDFLTPQRENFFRSLHAQPGWQIVELFSEGATVASLLGYRSDDAYFLYNSAYNHEYREASPGIVALYLLIEHLNESGLGRIDLLKGDEVYKFRLGAKLRRLYKVTF